MSTGTSAGRAFAVWRVLLLSQLREQPGRLLVTLIAIALGVALGAAVYLVNTAALNEFGSATKRLVGEADVIVRGPREGFPESMFVDLVHDPAVEAASAVLELEAALPGRHDTLKILGLDPFRAAALQPQLIGAVGGAVFDLFGNNSILLSAAAAEQLSRKRGDPLPIIVGNSAKSLRIIGLLPEQSYSQAIGIMDIASAQWLFGQVGRLNRVDLRLKAGVDVEAYRMQLSKRLPAGVLAIAPQVERDRAVTVTRAYRVNLNMLALVALWTGAFLVFSTQSLSVLRRRRALGLLRALGTTRREMELALIGEGAALGFAGSLVGILLGEICAAAVLRALAGDLGNGQLHAFGANLHSSALSLLGFSAIGTAVASAGAWLPARTAARQAPAKALKGGDAEFASTARRNWLGGTLFMGLGAALAPLPAVRGIPVFGYASIAALLFGAVLLVPLITIRILRLAPRIGRAVPDLALAQLKENVALSTLSLASIIVSFSLMVAMAIMVYSFRVSFDQWLGKLLPADLQLREPFGNDTAYWSAQDQANLGAVPGVARIEFRRTRPLLLDSARPPVTLIARRATPLQVTEDLPMMQQLPGATLQGEPAWISEALADLYGYKLGASIELPLGGVLHRFTVAGVWRDYARTSGAVVITRTAYTAATGDETASEGSVWLAAGASPARVEQALRACFQRPDSVEILTSTALREKSLQIFDRAFAITYALEAIAVLIGLTGVSFAASSTALARRAEFGMLRHIGMRKNQIVGMLVSEGVLTSTLGVIYGLVLGGLLSLLLVYVVNRQSFNWSIDFAVPAWQLAALCVTLIVAAAITAVWSGRAAMNQDAVRAVREDW